MDTAKPSQASPDFRDLQAGALANEGTGPLRRNGSARRRLLLVEDDESIRSAVCKVATEWLGIDVTVATNGRAAAMQLNAAPWDLLMTDILMPEMDGLELIRLARGLKSAPVIIAMSGGGSYGIDHLQVARIFGASFVLPKPFAAAELIEILRRAIFGGP